MSDRPSLAPDFAADPAWHCSARALDVGGMRAGAPGERS
jgi:hypothetical protein